MSVLKNMPDAHSFTRNRTKPAIALAIIFLVVLAPISAAADSSSASPDSGKVHVTQSANKIALHNQSIEAVWQIVNGFVTPVSVTDKLTRKIIPVPRQLFWVGIADGAPISSSQMKVTGGFKVEALSAVPCASRYSERVPGQQVSAELQDNSGRLHATWRAILRDGSSYIRQEVTLNAVRADLRVSEVTMVDLDVTDASVAGVVKGSPVVAGNFYFGLEHPLSQCKVTSDHAVCKVVRELPLRTGQSVVYSSVIGITPIGQLRRGFLNYIERERAHPYRSFLHYNSWYDLGYFNKFDETGALNVINTYGAELVQKRGVKLDSFLFDDGWDDNATLWRFHSGFPNGFTPLREAAAKYGAAPGVWLSPWGGYDKPRDERLSNGKKMGFEMNEGGFALSGPKYFERFRETTLEFINKYGINQFKIDGTGNVNSAIEGSSFDSDFHAAISLIQEWRSIKPDIYVNLTTGTYPSPFWLRYADSIWRGGEDHSFAGVGSKRQQWITYRDAATYSGIVQSGPLFPLNSLMLHGLIYAKRAQDLNSDPNGDFESEVHSYFGSGTQLQEMYVTPSLLKEGDWDTLAESGKWSRNNADVLVDTHWVGGNPAALEVYGWASWSTRKGILVLRNPSDKPQTFVVDVEKAFELPPGASRNYVARSPWAKDKAMPVVKLTAGQPYTFHLEPFQVLTLDATPQK